MAFQSGCNGRVIINGTILKARRWSVNAKADLLDTTNFESGDSDCFADYIGGVREAEVTLEIIWDSTDDPFTNPPTFFPAQELTDVHLFLIKGDNANRWIFETMLVESATMDVEVRGVITFNLTLRSKGSFTAP